MKFYVKMNHFSTLDLGVMAIVPVVFDPVES